jgi:transposase
MLGIDVSKETLTCALLSAADRRLCWEMTVPNTAHGIAQLVRRTPPSAAWVVEPTGIYSRRVVQQAHAAGRPVLLAQPKRAKAFLAAVQPRAKTDRVDSRGLALYGLSAALRPFPIMSEAMERIEQLLAARKGISESVARLRQQRAVLPHAAVALTAAITALEGQQTAVDQQLTAARALLPVVTALQEIPGIGPVTATAVALCLTSKQFDHPDQFVAYVGLDTRVRDSGQHQGRRALSKQGEAELRRLLYLCAQANLRSTDPENPFKAQYEREKAKGLTTTGALCAVARKLARTCWSLAAHGTRYEATRVHHQSMGGTARRTIERSKTP